MLLRDTWFLLIFLGKHYEVDVKNQKVELTQFGFRFVEQIVGKHQ